MEIKGILVSLLAPFEDHIANGGEKLLGNASSIKRRPDGRVYISGQMQRHVLFSAIDRLNNADKAKGDTFVSNGDGITDKIESVLGRKSFVALKIEVCYRSLLTLANTTEYAR